MPVLAPGLAWVDLKFRGSPNVIATAVISDAGGVALIDPGPTSCLDALELGLNGLGIRFTDVTHVLLTHVHLDHAGVTGTLVRRHPALSVFVHERGAPHLIDPTKLVRSATRLWGDQMLTLWGEVAPVPASNIVTLTVGQVLSDPPERIDVPGRTLRRRVHAGSRLASRQFLRRVEWRRVCRRCRRHPHRRAITCVRRRRRPTSMWSSGSQTAACIEAWDPATMFLTHFGPSDHVRPHLQSLIENLEASARWVRASLLEQGSDEERARRYAEYVDRELKRHLTGEQILPHLVGAPFEVSWLGLARYWRKKGIGL